MISEKLDFSYVAEKTHHVTQQVIAISLELLHICNNGNNNNNNYYYHYNYNYNESLYEAYSWSHVLKTEANAGCVLHDKTLGCRQLVSVLQVTLS